MRQRKRPLSSNMDTTPAVMEERRQRVLALAVNPFGVDGEDPEERAPSWLDLFADLFMAGALQIYSVNAASGASQYIVATAVTFWLLVWTTWTSGVSFDTRFYTNDWINVLFKVRQAILQPV